MNKNTHTFCFNPQDNGGESLILKTTFEPNGDPGEFYAVQELMLHSYCNYATFTLTGIGFTPENLRKLADELEQFEKDVKGS